MIYISIDKATDVLRQMKDAVKLKNDQIEICEKCSRDEYASVLNGEIKCEIAEIKQDEDDENFIFCESSKAWSDKEHEPRLIEFNLIE